MVDRHISRFVYQLARKKMKEMISLSSLQNQSIF